jgi:hypothetical protein
VVELKNIKFIPEETKKARSASRTLHRAANSITWYDERLEKPLKFKKHLTDWPDKKGFWRKGKMKDARWYMVWRTPTGKFAKKLPPAERALKVNAIKDLTDF